MNRHVMTAAAAALLSRPVPAAAQTRIVFAAGPKDHGGPGAHEYATDLAALKACLDSSNVRGLTTSLFTDKVPDASALQNAAVQGSPAGTKRMGT